MQRLSLMGRSLVTGLCLTFIAGIAAAEPVKPAPKKHPECQETKVKTACNHAADVKDFVTSIQVPPTPAPTADGQQTTVPQTREELQPAKEDSAGAKPPPESVGEMAPRA